MGVENRELQTTLLSPSCEIFCFSSKFVCGFKTTLSCSRSLHGSFATFTISSTVSYVYMILLIYERCEAEFI